MITYIAEIDRHLTDDELKIWNDEGPLAKTIREYYRNKWREEYRAKINAQVCKNKDLKQSTPEVKPVATSTPKPLPIGRRDNKCEHLGKRTEFKNGCGGWSCKHECDLGLPAVPGGYCQMCNKYEDSGARY